MELEISVLLFSKGKAMDAHATPCPTHHKMSMLCIPFQTWHSYLWLLQYSEVFYSFKCFFYAALSFFPHYHLTFFCNILARDTLGHISFYSTKDMWPHATQSTSASDLSDQIKHGGWWLFTLVFCTFHLWYHHPGHILKSGINGALVVIT